MKSFVFASLVSVGALCIGCAPQSEPTPEHEDSASRGEAVKGTGSCEAGGQLHCGGQSDDGCWCDTQCAAYGDCCGDVGTTCGTDECVVGQDSTCGDDAFCQPGICLAYCQPDDPGCCAPSQCVPDVPAPEACMTDESCGEGRVCDHSVCLNPCPPDAICIAACFGQCVDAEPEPEPEPCGNTTCGEGTYCCNASCGICAPEGGFCTQQACAPMPAADSCQDHCGGSSEDGSCWCDDLCSSYGDCCEDFEPTCES